MAVHQKPGAAVADRAGESADAGGNHGGAAGLGFQRHEAEGFAVGRHDDDVGRAVPGGQFRCADRRVVGDGVVQSGGADEGFEVEILGAAECTKDGEFKVDVGASLAEQGGGLEQDLRAFETLDPAGEEQVEGAGADAVVGAGSGAERGGEDGEIDAGGATSMWSKSAP